jgi:hypothetical protein
MLPGLQHGNLPYMSSLLHGISPWLLWSLSMYHNHPCPFDQAWPTRVWPRPARTIQQERVAAWAERRGLAEKEAAALAAKPFRFEDLNGAPEPESWGPVYPALPSVDKWRKLARKQELTGDETRAYGAAVHAAIRLLQRQELGVTGKAEVDLRCTAFDARKHRGKLTAALHAQANADRRAWATSQAIAEAYEAAMKAKRARLAALELRKAA